MLAEYSFSKFKIYIQLYLSDFLICTPDYPEVVSIVDEKIGNVRIYLQYNTVSVCIRERHL